MLPCGGELLHQKAANHENNPHTPPKRFPFGVSFFPKVVELVFRVVNEQGGKQDGKYIDHFDFLDLVMVAFGISKKESSPNKNINAALIAAYLSGMKIAPMNNNKETTPSLRDSFSDLVLGL